VLKRSVRGGGSLDIFSFSDIGGGSFHGSMVAVFTVGGGSFHGSMVAVFTVVWWQFSR